MKNFFIILLTVALCVTNIFSFTVCAESESKPVYADSLNNGTYNIEVDSSSSMFRIVDCKLVVSDGKMTALMTMSGQGYGMVFPGTGEEALNADPSRHIDFTLNGDGQKVFELPVEALDTPIDCAAWSIKKEQWYDRKLVFKSETLPKEAFKFSIHSVIILISSAVVILAVVIVIVFIRRKRSGGK